MKKMLLSALVCFFLVGVNSYAVDTRATSPEAIHSLFPEYLADKNLEAIGTLFHENAIYIPAKGAEAIVGRENIKEALKPYLGSSAPIETLYSAMQKNGDTVLATSKWRISLGNGRVVEGTSIEVMRQQSDGTWVYIIDSPYGL